MTANELRIGNLILDEDSNIMYTVDLNFFHDLSSGGFLMDDLIPIPITDEWLVKFGFNKSTENVFKILHTDNNFGFSVKLYSSDAFKEKIKSVHQLQNLYFALTGEELKIN